MIGAVPLGQPGYPTGQQAFPPGQPAYPHPQSAQPPYSRPQSGHPLLPPVIPPEQQWKKKFPTIVSVILSILQLILTIAIIGCELGSILIDIVTATIYVGFWSGLFFMIAWISQAVSSCCCRSRGCATYTLVIECISLFFAACVIGFDSYYIVNPTTCFFSSTVCNSGTSRGVFYTDSNFNNIKIPLIKAQLAAGAVMFVLCLIYIIIYVITTIRIHRVKTAPTVFPQTPYSFPVVPTGPDGMIIAPPMTNIRPVRAGSPLYHRPAIVIDNGEGRTNDLLCPTCSTMMNVTVKKRPPQ